MVGITLSPEQIRSAPPEVRHWIEEEIAASLGHGSRGHDAPEDVAEHLVACTPLEAESILAQIQGVLPVTNVFFELGREGRPSNRQGVRVLALPAIMAHAQLQGMPQLASCLEMINEAVRQVRGDPQATLFLIDPRGFCLIAEEAQESIRRVWQRIVGEHRLEEAQGRTGPRLPTMVRADGGFAPSPFAMPVGPGDGRDAGAFPFLGAVDGPAPAG